MLEKRSLRGHRSRLRQISGLPRSLGRRREFFPEIDPEAARVERVSPGASALEIEESLARKVEDAIGNVSEVRRIETTVSEGSGVVVVKFDEGTDVGEGVDDVERAIERLTDLPADAERIRVVEFEPNLPVVIVTLFGDADERTRKRTMRGIADDLESLPGMGTLQIAGMRDYEVRIEVQPDRLLQYGIPITAVADAVGAWTMEVPGGTVRDRGGNVAVRTMGVSERADAISAIVVRAMPGGDSIRVRDLAEVSEGFVDLPVEEYFDGAAAISATIYKTGTQDAVEIARMAYA